MHKDVTDLSCEPVTQVIFPTALITDLAHTLTESHKKCANSFCVHGSTAQTSML